MFYGNRKICVVRYKIRIYTGHGRPVEILHADDAWPCQREIAARHHVVFKIHTGTDWPLVAINQLYGSVTVPYKNKYF